MEKVGFYDYSGTLQVEDGYFPADTEPPATNGIKEVILRKDLDYQIKTLATFKDGSFYLQGIKLTNVNWWKERNHTYIWKDIVKVNGSIYTEEFEISGEMDDENTYRIDDFLEAVAQKYAVDTDDIETYMLDDIEFDPKTVPFGAEDCGCYIDGVAEWLCLS